MSNGAVDLVLTRTHFRQNCHCERSAAISPKEELPASQRDCRVALLLAMTNWVRVRDLVIPRNNPINGYTMGGLIVRTGLTAPQFRDLP